MPAAKRAKAKPAAATFSGFDRGLLRYLASLEVNNEKAWFEARRGEYDRLYLEPAKAFTAAILPKLAKLGSKAPQAGGLMRVYRDTRFSKDKTPYKTALHLRFASDKLSPALMFRVTGSSLGIATGCFGFDPNQLARYRKALGNPAAVRALRSAITKAEKAGYALPEPHLARIPRGFDADHPAGELLRRKGLSLGSDRALPAELFGAKALDYMLARFRELMPVYDWLSAHIH